MKRPTEKQPIDDLFDRKLGNMSLPPSPDGFERLQARMGQGRQETPLVFWRNPVAQRYMAAAACLLLVCSLGWFYGSSPLHRTNETRLATNQPVPLNPRTDAQKPVSRQETGVSPDKPGVDSSIEETSANRIARTEKAAGAKKVSEKRTSQPEEPTRTSVQILPSERDTPVLAQAKSVKENHPSAAVDPGNVSITEPLKPEQVATSQTTPKPAPVTERVLVVTIAEPAALVAARQTTTETEKEKPVVAATEQAAKEAKEAKAGSLWQQIKRIKQGEVLARRDNSNDDERGLLGRAYNGLKQNFEKDKPAKQ